MREVSKIGYLHLTWTGFNQYDILKNVKTSINKKFNDKIEKQEGIPENFSEIEGIYNARTQTMSRQIEQVFQQKGYDVILQTIDDVADSLPSNASKKARDFSRYAGRLNDALIALEKIIKVSNPELKKSNASALFSYIGKLKQAINEKSLINIDKDGEFLPKLRKFLNTQASGLALEVFSQAALVDANITGLQEVLHVGNKVGKELLKMDGRIQQDYDKQRRQLEKINQEPGVDVLLTYKSGEGGSLTYSLESFEGIQVKNYTDVSSIPLGGRLNTTLGQLNIQSFFGNPDNLVNAAATFGSQVSEKTENLPKYFFDLVNNQQNQTTQWELNQEWLEAIDQIRQLASLDAMAHNNLGYLNQAMYYLVRDKSNAGKIRIISKYDILKNAQKAFNFTKRNDKGYRIYNWKTDKEVNRYNYTKIHEKYFKDAPEDDNEIDKINRSQEAYAEILRTIEKTKISVAFNAISF